MVVNNNSEIMDMMTKAASYHWDSMLLSFCSSSFQVESSCVGRLGERQTHTHTNKQKYSALFWPKEKIPGPPMAGWLVPPKIAGHFQTMGRGERKLSHTSLAQSHRERESQRNSAL